MSKKLALTMGDPAGIGPEILAKALAPEFLDRHAVIVVGVPSIIERAFREFRGASIELKPYQRDEVWERGFRLLEMDEPVEPFEDGQVSKEAGRLALESIRLATELCLKAEAHAVVTTPVSKEAIELSGVPFDGHTGYIAKCCGVTGEMMMMSYEKLHVGYVTTHIPLNRVSTCLSEELILNRLKLSWDYVRKLGQEPCEIAVCGLNPHAGEGGHMGHEEIDIVTPAILKAQAEGIQCSGPHPSDTLFVERFRKEYGVLLALYHDQGGIPFKMLAFDHGVNHTLGLPIVRTSVDHGTAWDIAWKGEASEESLIAAMVMAEQLAS